MSISRRRFLESTALTSLAGSVATGAEVDSKTGMPTRVLGRTGARVSILAFGCGSRFLAYKDPEKAAEALNRALDQGITYVDTAYSYGNGRSETWVGSVMKTRRKGIWLTTKVQDRNGDNAMRIIEGSLKRLQTDHVDLIHVHSMTDDDDLAKAEAKDGVHPGAAETPRSESYARHRHHQSHRPAVLQQSARASRFRLHADGAERRARRHAHAPGGMAPNYMHDSFESLALPVANRKKMGVIAMKVFAQEGLVGKAPVEKLIQFSMSLPVSAVVIGMPRLDFVDQNTTPSRRRSSRCRQ